MVEPDPRAKRAHRSDAIAVGLCFGIGVYLRAWSLCAEFWPRIQYAGLAHLAMAVVGMAAALLMALAWQRSRSAVVCWAIVFGALVLAYAKSALWNLPGMTSWEARGAAFAFALPVALAAALLVAFALRRSGPRMTELLTESGRVLFLFAVFAHISPLLIF